MADKWQDLWANDSCVNWVWTLAQQLKSGEFFLLKQILLNLKLSKDGRI